MPQEHTATIHIQSKRFRYLLERLTQSF